MKKTLLIFTIILSVSGYSQTFEKEYKLVNETYFEHNYQLIKDSLHFNMVYLQPFIKKDMVVTKQQNCDNETKLCLDSIVSPRREKNVILYDNRGNTVLYAYSKWNNTLKEWTMDYRYTCEYDSNNNMTMESELGSPPAPPYSKSEYTYDNNGKIITSIWYNLNNPVEWQPVFKREYEYDVIGNRLLCFQYIWSPGWYLYEKYEYEYDDNGNHILTLGYGGNQEGWKLKSKYEYKYDTNRNHISTLVHVLEDNLFWRYDSKQEFYYDFYNKITLIAYYGWNWAHNALTLTDKWDFSYDIRGNMIICEEYIERYNYIQHNKYEYEYDNNDNLIKHFGYYWSDNGWVLYDKWEHEYDFSFSKTDLVIPDIKRQTVYSLQLLFNNGFDMNFKKTEEKWYSSWYGGDGISFFYWSPKNIGTETYKSISQSPSIKLFPNPVSRTLCVETDYTQIDPVVKIYSIHGALLLSTKGTLIDVSSLPNGIYIAEINGVINKIVKCTSIF